MCGASMAVSPKGEVLANMKGKTGWLTVVRFEDILRKFAGQVIMNIHVKPLSYDGAPYPEKHMKRIVELLRRYGAEQHAYFMLETDEQILQFKAYAPDIPICVGALPPRWNIVERAIRFGCEKVQLFKPYFNEEMIRQVHEHGIRCNVFWSDDPEETKSFLRMGIDTVLTNDYNLVSQCVER